MRSDYSHGTFQIHNTLCIRHSPPLIIMLLVWDTAKSLTWCGHNPCPQPWSTGEHSRAITKLLLHQSSMSPYNCTYTTLSTTPKIKCTHRTRSNVKSVTNWIDILSSKSTSVKMISSGWGDFKTQYQPISWRSYSKFTCSVNFLRITKLIPWREDRDIVTLYVKIMWFTVLVLQGVHTTLNLFEVHVHVCPGLP